jgi:hypothetical protein
MVPPLNPPTLMSEVAPGFGRYSPFSPLLSPSPWNQRLPILLGRMCPPPNLKSGAAPGFGKDAPPNLMSEAAPGLGKDVPRPPNLKSEAAPAFGKDVPPPPNLKSEAAPGFGKVPCCVWTPRYKLHKLNLCNHVVQPTGINKSSAEPPFLYLYYTVQYFRIWRIFEQKLVDRQHHRGENYGREGAQEPNANQGLRWLRDNCSERFLASYLGCFVQTVHSLNQRGRMSQYGTPIGLCGKSFSW